MDARGRLSCGTCRTHGRAMLCCAVPFRPGVRQRDGNGRQAGWLAISHYLYISGEKA